MSGWRQGDVSGWEVRKSGRGSERGPGMGSGRSDINCKAAWDRCGASCSQCGAHCQESGR
eukprot:60855-Chlamydomonas_euryale.AAC.1